MEPILFIAPTKETELMAEQITGEIKYEIPIETCRINEIQDDIQKYPDIGIYISRGGIATTLNKLSGKQ